MIQLPLFVPQNLVKRKKDGEYFIVDKILNNDYFICYSYVPNYFEKECGIYYYIEKDELEALFAELKVDAGA